jgi:hypothetical protein
MSIGRRKNHLVVCLGAGLALAAIGCGGSAPHATEVTEAWTSGDERVLGIESAAEAPTSEAAPAGSAGDD